MITLTPLSASASSSDSEPISYLLELDDARILLDLGQRDYRATADHAYEKRIQDISLVLLSHSPSLYLGLYPYARAHWGLTCPAYATQPTVEMGRVVCLSEAESWRAEVDVEVDGDSGSGSGSSGNDAQHGNQDRVYVPTVEEVHQAFDWIKPIRYNQPLHLGGELAHLLLTPFPSGHTLGGTLFKIRSPTSGTVLYATGINHTGERHLDGLVGQGGYDEGLIRPDLLIVEGCRAEVSNAKRKEREKAVVDTITHTLSTSRSVLMPCDPSPRLLELLVLLDQHWGFKRKQGDWPHPLCVVSRTGTDMVSFARSLVEWMGGVVRDNATGDEILAVAMGKRRGRKRGNDYPAEVGTLEFKNVIFFHSPSDLLRAHPVNRPKVVLAIPPSMSHGPSRWLFTAMGATEGNVILLTSRGEPGTLTRDMYEMWAEQQNDDAGWGSGRIGNLALATGSKQVELRSKVPLAGLELDAHLEAERLAKEREAANAAAAERSKRMLEADDLDSDSDSDESDDGVLPGAGGRGVGGANANDYTGRAGEGEGDEARQMSFDIYVKGQQMRVGRARETRFRMFPYIEKRARRIDDYGEGLDVGQWVRKGREIAEEGETEDVREAKRRKAEEDERRKAPPEPPSKFITEMAVVPMKASIFYVDMEGLHDGQAIKTIISDLQPRKLIIINAPKSSSQALHSHFSSLPVYTPALNETVRIGEHVASYSLMLGDAISASLKWAKFEGYEVALLSGQIALSAGSTVPRLEPASAQSQSQSASALAIMAPAENAIDDAHGSVSAEGKIDESESTPTGHGHGHGHSKRDPDSLFVGDLRLAGLKARLGALGMPAEFAGEGVLVCGPGVKAQMDGGKAAPGSMVAVRKVGEGVVVEGSAGKVYWAVRKEVYGSLAQVV